MQNTGALALLLEVLGGVVHMFHQKMLMCPWRTSLLQSTPPSGLEESQINSRTFTATLKVSSSLTLCVLTTFLMCKSILAHCLGSFVEIVLRPLR